MAKPHTIVTSFIDVDAWNRAGWTGAGFMTPPDDPPSMALMFRNEAAARSIFQGFRALVGPVDEHELLLVSIIEGPIEGQPKGYSIFIGSNVENVRARAVAQGLAVSSEAYTVGRYHRMEPEPGSPFLGNFKQAFAKHRKYRLLPAVGQDPSKPPKILGDLSIVKTEVSFLQSKDLTRANLEWVVLGKNIK
jgi:hypothetical protein